MRISDWSSDVCSSDLPAERLLQWTDHHAQGIYVRLGDHDPDDGSKHDTPVRTPFTLAFSANQAVGQMQQSSSPRRPYGVCRLLDNDHRSEEHTSELQSLMRLSYAVFCLKHKKNTNIKNP